MERPVVIIVTAGEMLSYKLIVSLIASTTTKAGLTVKAAITDG
jgi:hypothetical protein